MKTNWCYDLRTHLLGFYSNVATGFNEEIHDLITWDSMWNLIYHSLLNPTDLVPTLMSVYLGAADYTTKGFGDCERVLNDSNTKE